MLKEYRLESGTVSGVKLVKSSVMERLRGGTVEKIVRARGVAVFGAWRSIDPVSGIISHRKSVTLRGDDLAAVAEAAGVPTIMDRFPRTGEPSGAGDPADSRALVAYLASIDTLTVGSADDDIVF